MKLELKDIKLEKETLSIVKVLLLDISKHVGIKIRNNKECFS